MVGNKDIGHWTTNEATNIEVRLQRTQGPLDGTCRDPGRHLRAQKDRQVTEEAGSNGQREGSKAPGPCGGWRGGGEGDSRDGHCSQRLGAQKREEEVTKGCERCQGGAFFFYFIFLFLVGQGKTW